MTDRRHNSLAAALKKAFSQDSRLPKLLLDRQFDGSVEISEAIASSHHLQGFDQRSSIGNQPWAALKAERQREDSSLCIEICGQMCCLARRSAWKRLFDSWGDAGNEVGDLVERMPGCMQAPPREGDGGAGGQSRGHTEVSLRHRGSAKGVGWSGFERRSSRAL